MHNCCRHHGRPFLGLWPFLKGWCWLGGLRSSIKCGPGYIHLWGPGCPGGQKMKWRVKLRSKSNLKGLHDTDRRLLMLGMIIKLFAVVTKWLKVLKVARSCIRFNEPYIGHSILLKCFGCFGIAKNSFKINSTVSHPEWGLCQSTRGSRSILPTMSMTILMHLKFMILLRRPCLTLN